MPPELLLMILEQLPPESAVAFALTCRAFYAARRADDVVGAYSCYSCDKLHPATMLPLRRKSRVPRCLRLRW
ncbi:hypothetical protein B0T24DRAFT_722833 [Lasiosphaeria ovina]|uniref:F-box domain-containing protein n=1 Tax=Lasiosphaeria ovina TaxID=92902 RepID=A0AAE0JYY4_9PEZI|nr:hypothetical protein B0T24DRAFT_722833 [Lasiosphaeria ovina]